MTVLGLAVHRRLIHAQALVQFLPTLGHDQNRPSSLRTSSNAAFESSRGGDDM